MIICTDDIKMTLPTRGASIEQYREQGVLVGRAYFDWYLANRESPDAPEGINDNLIGGYLLVLNKKMEPVFSPSDQQLDAFNEAAVNECVRLVERNTATL